jgi:hypothetical protein
MKNKYTILISLVIIATILLAGCSSAAAATASTNNGLATATWLAAGTLKLEGTDQAVTASQAAQMLTLWEGYQSITNSDTSSLVELDALVAQIRAALTADQLQAIEAMDLTEQSVSELIQATGGSVTSSAPASTPGSSTLSQANPGGAPGAMPGAGGDSVMSAISGGVTTQSTPVSTQAITNSRSSQVSPILIQALIQLLQTRSQASG